MDFGSNIHLKFLIFPSLSFIAPIWSPAPYRKDLFRSLNLKCPSLQFFYDFGFLHCSSLVAGPSIFTWHLYHNPPLPPPSRMARTHTCEIKQEPKRLFLLHLQRFSWNWFILTYFQWKINHFQASFSFFLLFFFFTLTDLDSAHQMCSPGTQTKWKNVHSLLLLYLRSQSGEFLYREKGWNTYF